MTFVKGRKQFRRPIAEFEGLQWMLADMAVALKAARLSLHQAALSADPFPNSLIAAPGEDHRFRDGQHGHERGAAAVRRQGLLAGLSPRTHGSKIWRQFRRHPSPQSKPLPRLRPRDYARLRNTQGGHRTPTRCSEPGIPRRR